ncbi:uracil-DNA glycosylase [Paraburkholderia acidipaludis]|uniref:uracil-DNA glycosylase n=1 Tax=Paraburkholderia acidipaludis TaxID=660537 RepID=UPI0004821DCE|nr:uracil-DNA glycosylase [Paraburkholderia acidipaludis]
MALDEFALAELGLSPRWVSKGARATAAGVVQTGEETQVAGPAGVPAQPEATLEPPEPLDPPGAVEPNVVAPEPSESRTPERVPPRASAAAVRDPAAPSAEAHAAPAPPTLDEPPPLTEDDFGWFDAAPVPAEPSVPSPAPGNDVATLDWDTLAERVAGCTRCRLCEKRTNTVFGVGNREADWMVIGEAPGENEDRQGEPFVGQAGKLLDNMLRALSLSRVENVYIANVLKCRPPGNRNPEPDEVARCEPYLKRQVALVKPKIIIAMGRFAAQSLLKSEGSIASMRGRVHEYEGVPVIVTYHPAYLLRSLQDKSKAWADLCLARDTWRAAGGGQ